MNKILIIEDDLEINALLADFLKEKGYAVHCQYDGLHVLDFLNKEKIDLIILDIMLPYRSGDIILSDVRKKFTIPVIIISAKETTQNKIDLLRLGADDYITKPFDTESHVFPDREHFIPNRLFALTASSVLPYPDSKHACATVMEARIPLAAISSLANGPIFSTNSFSVMFAPI